MSRNKRNNQKTRKKILKRKRLFRIRLNLLHKKIRRKRSRLVLVKMMRLIALIRSSMMMRVSMTKRKLSRRLSRLMKSRKNR